MSESHYLNAQEFMRAVSEFEEIVKGFTEAVNKFQDAVDDIPSVIKVEMPKEDD